MTLRPEYSLGHSEYNAFLFASLGDEETGLPLTVQTALTRLGLDPWKEAARLSDLPRAVAATALAAAMARLPDGAWKGAGLPEIAERLVAHLPRQSTPAIPAVAAITAKRFTLPRTKSGVTAWLIWIGLAIALYVGLISLQGNKEFEPARRDGGTVQRGN